jgi:hypothetical protein
MERLEQFTRDLDFVLRQVRRNPHSGLIVPAV